MFWKSYICCLLLALSQMVLGKMSGFPEGLIRASEVYVLPWTPPVTERPPIPKRKGGDGQASSACTLGVSCKVGDRVVETSVKDITGPTGPRGERGLAGLQGPPGPPGPAPCRVAFSVALESKYIGYTGKIFLPLQFDKVIMNRGNAFDVDTGIFTAPSNQTFVFHVNVAAQKGKKAAAQLHLNGKFLATVWAESIHGYGFASNRFVLELVTDDKLRITILKRAPYLRDERFTSMRGWCM